MKKVSLSQCGFPIFNYLLHNYELHSIGDVSGAVGSPSSSIVAY